MAALQATLETTQEDIATILANNNVVSENITINNAATLAYATALGDKLAIVNGNVTIVQGELDTEALSAVTSKLVTIVGTVSTTAADTLDFSNLTAVSGNYAVAGHDVDDSALASVADVTLNYEGAYSQPALKTAGAIVITNKTSTVTGTIAVDFSGLTSGTIKDAASAAGTLNLDSATSVVIGSGAPVISLTAPKALTVELHNAGTLASLTVDTVSATSVIVQATKVTGAATITATADVTLAATTAGSLTISAGKLSAAALTASGATIITADEISLPTLATLSAASTLTTDALTLGAIATVTGTLTLDGPTDINFPALTKADIINADTALSFSAGALTTSAVINTASATTMVLKSATAAHIADLATSLESLTLNGQATAFDAGAAAALTSLSVTGTSSSASTFAVGNAPELVSVSLAGKFASATIEGALAELTTVSTSGLIESLTVSGTTALVNLNLGHTAPNTSTLVVVNNTKLGSLTTSTDYMTELTVTGNSALTSADFSSYTNVVNDTAATASVTIAIGTNSLTATFTPATAAGGSTAFAEATIVSASLASLSGYIQDVYDVDPAMISLSMDPAATTKGTAISAFSAANPNGTQVSGSTLPTGAIASEEANALVSAN